MDIATWLRDHQLERFAGVFRDQDIDLDLLCQLTDQELEKIGITSLGARRKILKACRSMQRPIGPQKASPSTDFDFPEKQKSPAERRRLKVVFVDLVGSTALSSSLDPEDMAELLKRYQNVVAGVVTRFGGFVAKFMGDGVIAYFGWPRAHEDDAERAVRAGLEIAGEVAKLSAPSGDPLACRLGIASGLVVVGETIGEGNTEEHAVVGETPNLAARLQSLAQPGQVVVSTSVQKMLGQQFDVTPMGEFDLKGLAKPQQVFAVESERISPSRFDAKVTNILPMVGRDQELMKLRDQWQQCTHGHGQCTLLIGDAGIGKSRTLRALLSSISNQPHMAVRFQCSPFHADNPLWPVIQQLKLAADISENEAVEANLDRIERAFGKTKSHAEISLIAELLGFDGTSKFGSLALTPQAKRNQTIEALVRHYGRLSSDQPVLMILEDAHWIDATTLELIGLFADAIRKMAIFLIVTSRPDNVPTIAAHPHVRKLTLNRLGRSGIRSMIVELAGNALSEDIVEPIIERTDGVPLFIEEMTKAVLEAGRSTIPASLHDSLMSRLDQQRGIREIAQLASCIGRQFDYRLLSLIARDEIGDIDFGLERLEAVELVFRRGEVPNAVYTFKHALVQDAAYESLLRSRRHTLHAMIAERIESDFPALAASEPDLLAHHYANANLPDKAADQWLLAAQRSIARSANKEAIAQIQRGMQELAKLPDSPQRDRRELTFRRLLGTATMAVKGYGAPDNTEIWSSAIALCDRLGESADSDVSVALFGAFLFAVTRADYYQSGKHANDLLMRADRSGDPVAAMYGYLGRGLSDTFLGKPDVARAQLGKGLAIFEEQSDPEIAYRYGLHVGACLTAYNARNLAAMGFPDQALQSADWSVEILEETKHLFTFARGMYWNAMFHLNRGETDRAERQARRACESAEEQGFPMVLGVGRIIHGACVARSRDVPTGLDEMHSGMDVYQSCGANAELSFFHYLFAQIHLGRNDSDRAQRALNCAKEFMHQTDERFCEAEIHRLQAAIDLHLGSQNEAKASLQRAIETARSCHYRLFELRAATDFAALLAAEGSGYDANSLLAPIYSSFTEGFRTADLVRAHDLLHDL